MKKKKKDDFCSIIIITIIIVPIPLSQQNPLMFLSYNIIAVVSVLTK